MRIEGDQVTFNPEIPLEVGEEAQLLNIKLLLKVKVRVKSDTILYRCRIS